MKSGSLVHFYRTHIHILKHTYVGIGDDFLFTVSKRGFPFHIGNSDSKRGSGFEPF